MFSILFNVNLLSLRKTYSVKKIRQIKFKLDLIQARIWLDKSILEPTGINFSFLSNLDPGKLENEQTPAEVSAPTEEQKTCNVKQGR
jgi:hypothetical protein